MSRAALLLAVSLIAASSVSQAWAADDDDGSSSWSDSISNSLKNTFGGTSKMFGFGKPPAPPPPEAPSGCPTIAILDGTSAQRVMAPGATGNAGLKVQYSLLNVARQCSMSGTQMSVKVGGDGRVLLGPAGSNGRFDVPIRVVIFSEAQQKPVESKLYRVQASIGAGQSATPFEFVSDNIVVPVAGGRTAADYSIKVGIDSGKGSGVPAKAARHRRQKPTESASQ